MTTPNLPPNATKGTQPVPPWKKVICPFLTAGELARRPLQTIVQLGAQKDQLTAQPCLGPDCMLFATLKNADGSETHGCAPVQQLGVQLTLTRMVGRFIEAAEAGARAEAAHVAGASAPLTVVPEPSPLTEAADAADPESAP